MNRYWRRSTGLLAILALAFAQLAGSAYACPMTSSAQMQAAQPAHAVPCDRADPDRANLCERHCHDEGQSPNAPSGLPAAFIPAFIATLQLPPLRAPSTAVDEPALLHATSPPATIRNCCFRI